MNQSSLVKITNDAELQASAAKALSTILSSLGIRHVFIGGFALQVCGSARRTEDIDVLLDVDDPSKIRTITRPQIMAFNQQFNHSWVEVLLYFRQHRGSCGQRTSRCGRSQCSS